MKKYSGIRGKLDTLVGDYYRQRLCDYHGAGKGCAGRKEWSHIKSRRYLSTRWEILNSLTLCSKQHFYFTDHPDEFIHWIELTFPRRLTILQEIFNKKLEMKKWQMEELYEYLKETLPQTS